MIHGTLVKINRTVASKPKVATFDPLDRGPFLHQVIDIGWEFKPLKTISIKNKVRAFSLFSEYLSKDGISKKSDLYGMFLHKEKEYSSNKEIQLLYETDGKAITQTAIANPLWVGIEGVKRNLDSVGFSCEINMSMQSQLFAMLDSVSGDANWIQSFQLKDNQQKKLYEWQHNTFHSLNDMSVVEMHTLMKNILSRAKLPWLLLEFKEKGEACMFVLTSDSGKSITLDDDGDASEWDWLQKADEAKFENVGKINQNYRLRISDMRLVMIMEWAMNGRVLIHELGHYINFTLPTPYRMNRGEYKLNYSQYEELFSGHGAAYMAIYARLLIDFYYVDEEFLYDSLNDSGLCWFPIKSISVKDVTEGITQYCQRFEH